MSAEIKGIREQITANAKFLLQLKANETYMTSSTTLVTSTNSINIITSGEGSHIRGVVMLGMRPAIEGGEASTPEGALRKLLLAVSETMSLYLPKIGDHMRNIHGGGIFDEDLIAIDLRESSKRA